MRILQRAAADHHKVFNRAAACGIVDDVGMTIILDTIADVRTTFNALFTRRGLIPAAPSTIGAVGGIQLKATVSGSGGGSPRANCRPTSGRAAHGLFLHGELLPSCAPANASAVRPTPITSYPVERISGLTADKTPGNLLNGSTTSFTSSTAG